MPRPTTASLVDDVHDLLAGLVGPERAATATVEVLLRTSARARDGLHSRLDAPTLRRAAVDHAVHVGRRDGRSEPATRDLALLDLVERRGLTPRAAARTAGVRARGLEERRERAVASLTPHGQRAADVAVERAAAPLRQAPGAVHDATAAALGVEATGRSHGQQALRVAGIAAASVVALAAIALGTPRVVGDSTLGPPAVATGQPFAFTPTPSTVVVAGDDDGGTGPVTTSAGVTAPDAQLTDGEG